ncbi:Sirohydrochlorin ferrochelatase [Posidoniimonas corsicana]|uniref:Sirohydrochlorin ferrochelatase n=2 Tax=Posidoniimonas corsicana TaxID=1938618 RepID=A0A5C5VCZ8_9BACT|nr:Sirohydrochlorin ferrochelatase [Posidoniimonas corsicana]
MMPQPPATESLAHLLDSADCAGPIGLIIVDHGSRRDESNVLLLAVVESFRHQTGLSLVEPAHMELAEPSIEAAFARLVEQGAGRIIVAPFFLAPGKHWNEDIPELTRAAAARHGDTPFQVAEPLGLHPAMCEVLASRVAKCVAGSGS